LRNAIYPSEGDSWIMVENEGYSLRFYALMLSATTFVLNFTLIQPIYSLFLIGKGITVVQLGVLLSIQNFIPLLLRIPMSVVVERFGRIRSLIVGLIVAGISAVLFIYAQNYSQLLLVMVFSSITNSSFNQTAMSTVSDAAPPMKQGDAMGRYLTFLAIGMLIGPAACSRLVESIGYNGLYWIAAVVPVIGVILLVFLAPQNIRKRQKLEDTKSIGATESMKMLLHNRSVVLLSICRVGFSTAQAIFLALFSIYAVEQLGFSEATVALLFTVRGFANTLARYPAGWVSDKIGRKPLLFAGYGLLVVSYTMIAYTKSVLMLSIALALYGLCWGTRAVSEWAYLTDLVEPEIKTISISYLSSVFSLGSTIGSVAAGVLTLILPYSSIFMIGAALNLAALPALLSIKKKP
jgi:predicted MFS family arabinose efflux permease